jgi:transcriptional regulator with XRE-family HTH domain
MKKVIKIKEVGKGLRELRGDQTMKEFGVLLNLTSSHICDLEKGNKLPSLNLISRYAIRLNQEIHLILGVDS